MLRHLRLLAARNTPKLFTPSASLVRVSHCFHGAESTPKFVLPMLRKKQHPSSATGSAFIPRLPLQPGISLLAADPFRSPMPCQASPHSTNLVCSLSQRYAIFMATSRLMLPRRKPMMHPTESATGTSRTPFPGPPVPSSTERHSITDKDPVDQGPFVCPSIHIWDYIYRYIQDDVFKPLRRYSALSAGP